MDEKYAKKQKIRDIFDTYIGGIVGIAGFGLAMFGAWFQSVGFTYVDFIYCLLPFFAGGCLGAFAAYQMKKHDPKLTITSGMSRGYIFLMFLTGLLVFRATMVMSFVIGLVGMVFTAVLLVFVSVVKLRLKKAEKKEQA